PRPRSATPGRGRRADGPARDGVPRPPRAPEAKAPSALGAVCRSSAGAPRARAQLAPPPALPPPPRCRRAWGNRRSRSASPPAPSDLLFEQRSRRRVQRIRLAQHRAQKIPLPETGRRVGEPEKALLGDTLRPKRVAQVPQILEHPALALKLGANHLG